LLLGGIFFVVTPQYATNQTAVGIVHMQVNDYLVPLVTCTLTAAIVCVDTMLIRYSLLYTIIIIIIRVLRFYVVQCCIYFASDQNTAMLHTSIGIGIGFWNCYSQYYWILGALFGIGLTLDGSNLSS